MAIEKSVYIIKPEGMPHRSEIRHMIMGADLDIISSFTAAIPSWVIANLYPDLVQTKDELWIATNEHFGKEGCEVGTVQGEGAIKKLLFLCGDQTSPILCEPHTVRARFGLHSPLLAGERFYWKNAIHRSADAKEALRDLNIIAALAAHKSRAAVSTIGWHRMANYEFEYDSGGYTGRYRNILDMVIKQPME